MMATVLERIAPTKPKRPEAGTVNWFNDCVERGKRERFTEEVTVTPGLANVILSRNPDNRNIGPAKLEQYAADMRAGRFDGMNGATIAIAKTGELNDGQHRLQAVIEANTPERFMFMFGVERESRFTVDQGKARSAADFLGMEGVANATAVASIGRLAIAYEQSGRDNVNNANSVTNAEVRTRADTDERLHASASFAASHSKSTRNFAAPAIIGFCHYVLSEEHKGDAESYMVQICTGEGLKKSDPAYVVRDRLLSLGRNRIQKIEIILRGWNAYRAGRPLKIVKVLGNFPALV